MFRAYVDLSSGGTTYVYNNWYFLFVLDDSLLSWLDWNPTMTTDKSSNKKKISTNYIHRLYLLMMGLDMPETCRG